MSTYQISYFVLSGTGVRYTLLGNFMVAGWTLLSLFFHTTNRLFHNNFVPDNPVSKNFSTSIVQVLHYVNDIMTYLDVFVVMTMYNEDEDLFCRIMHGVIKNIAHLCKRDRSKT